MTQLGEPEGSDWLVWLDGLVGDCIEPRRSGKMLVLSCTVCRFVSVILPAAAHSSRSSFSMRLNFRLEILIE